MMIAFSEEELRAREQATERAKKLDSTDIDDFLDDEVLEEREEDVPKWFTELSKFERIGLSIGRIVLEKNKRYGNSALNPLNIFSELSAEEGIRVRLDDKLSRIRNSAKLRKNDVADIMGYLILLSLSKNWEDFSDLID